MILDKFSFTRFAYIALSVLIMVIPFTLYADERAEFPEFDDAEFLDDDFSDEDVLAEEAAFDIEVLTVWDPLEPVNRGIFWFNDKAYRYAFKPIAKGLRVVPRPVRKSGSNFFSNLFTPIRAVNSLLQLKLKKVGTELARFGINTTIGIGGLFDPADKHFNIKRHTEDLGQTLGTYGIGHGLYIVIPLLGPSSIRDGIGRVGDTFLNPVVVTLEREAAIAAMVFNELIYLSLDNDSYESLVDDSIDPYLTLRDAYLQTREKNVAE